MAAIVWILLLFCSYLPSCLSSCGPYGHDINTLLTPSYWWFKQSKNQCPPYAVKSTNNVSSSCNFFFSICNPVPIICKKDTVACAFIGDVMKDDALISWPLNYGLQSSVVFDVLGNQGFTASYTTGDSCIGSKKWETVVTFNCNSSVSWNITRNKYLKFGGAVSPKPKKFEIQSCTLKISFDANFACGPAPPGSESANLSIGSLLLILFIPSMFLYCIVGVLVNSHGGRRGKELVPHSKFWFDLPDLIMDGFLFVMNCLTCREACKQDPNRLYESI